MVRELFRVDPDPWQVRVLGWYGARRPRISIRSAHGVGKTALVSWCAVHQLLTRFPQKTVCTAPSSPQLFDALWPELGTWLGRLPGVLQDLIVITSDRVELKLAPDESFISARTARAEKPEALQGVHSPNVLIIADEASGIPEQIFEAAAGSMSGTGATTILTGNPVRTTGLFFDTHHKLVDMWDTAKVSHEDSPRVTDDFVNDIKRRYGPDSNAFRVRCLGEFPRTDEDTIIPFELIEAARTRDVAVVDGPIVWGVDVARFGSDRSALCKRGPNAVLGKIRTWRDLDLMQLTGAIKAEYDLAKPQERPTRIFVDVIGLGAGVCDRLRELGLPATGVNVSESPALGERFRNLRTELWFQAGEWLARRDVVLPPDELLAQELAATRYSFTSSGKLMAESKDKLRSRGLDSPDVADAFCLTFAGGAATAAGLVRGSDWKKPLPFNLKRVV